ncbi:MAG TPA: fused MFS/spermidine synthase [Myxococcota bacterium]|nr:fused MFS/spermidine synthase [Myxococcota bacterium]
MPVLLSLCFFLSGAGSLVLEVAWSRVLRLVFGTTTLAISTILVAYMTGLGIGGLLGGRLAPRVRDGVRAYGAIELAVGLYALAVPAIFAVFPALGRAWLDGLSFWPAAFARFALSLAVLVVPTVGMGMTLPFLTRALVRDTGAAGRGIALLYGVNTLGAVCGVFGSTFLLLPALGVRGSSLAGAGLYLAVGALALALARRWPAVEPVAPAPARESLARWNPALLAYATVGFTSLVYEVAWTRALSMVMGSSIYAFACMLAAFLLGIALGSLAVQPFADRLRRPLAVYAGGIAALGLLSLASLSLLPVLPAAFMGLVRRFGGSPVTLFGSQMAMAVAVMFPPALVLGALFPLLARAQATTQGAAPAAGDVYFANTLGSATGAFLAGFVLLPLLGLRGTAALAIATNLAAAAAVLLWRGAPSARGRIARAAPCALLAAAVSLHPPSLDTDPLARGGYVSTHIFDDSPDASLLEGVPPERMLYYRDGLSATVSVHEARGVTSLHLNGKADASTGGDMATQVLVAQAAMLFGPPAKRVLVVGWASGVTVGSAARHPVERLDAVELEPAMLEASRFFEPVNGRPLANPAVHVVLDDGRHFVAATHERYDVIISQPSNPWLTGVANLFTREYFHAARGALAPHGRFVAWFPLYAIDFDALRAILAALEAEFPCVYTLVLDRNKADLIVLARLEPLTPADLPRFESLPPAVQSDLYRIGTHSTAELWSLLRLMPEDVAALVGAGALENRDDNLFVELRTPWLLYADHFAPPGEGPSARAWARIDAQPLSRAGLLEPALAAPGAPRAGELALAYLNVRHDSLATARIAALAPDSGEVIAARAQFARSAGQIDEAHYAAELDRAAAREPDSYDVRMLRARERLDQEDSAVPGALADVDAALARRPGDPALLGVRASALLRLKRPVEARAALAEVERSEYWAQSKPLWFLAAIAALQAGDLPDGIRRLEAFTGAEPGFVQAWQLLEQACARQGRSAEAARARHNQALTLYWMALAAERAGDVTRARQTLQRALAVQPENAQARAALARLGG